MAAAQSVGKQVWCSTMFFFNLPSSSSLSFHTGRYSTGTDPCYLCLSPELSRPKWPQRGGVWRCMMYGLYGRCMAAVCCMLFNSPHSIQRPYCAYRGHKAHTVHHAAPYTTPLSEWPPTSAIHTHRGQEGGYSAVCERDIVHDGLPSCICHPPS